MNDTEASVAARQSLSPLVRGGILGCGFLLLVGVGASYWLYNYSIATIKEYEDLGFVLHSAGNHIDLRDDINEKRLYFANSATLIGHVTSDIAFFTRIVEISGTVDGSVYFSGDSLTVNQGAVIKGDLICRDANIIKIDGTLEGSVKGNPADLRDNRENAPLPADEAKPVDEEPASEKPAGKKK